MICNFCKSPIPENKELEISSPEEKLNCCSACMDDIVEIMESGALEDKTYKLSNEGTLAIDHKYLIEPLVSGRKRFFRNCRVLRIEPSRSDRYLGYKNQGYYSYDNMHSPIEILIELSPRENMERKIAEDYMTKYVADFSVLKP